MTFLSIGIIGLFVLVVLTLVVVGTFHKRIWQTLTQFFSFAGTLVLALFVPASLGYVAYMVVPYFQPSVEVVTVLPFGFTEDENAESSDVQLAAAADENKSEDKLPPKPDWLSQHYYEKGDTTYLRVSGRQFATVEEAEQDATQFAVRSLSACFNSQQWNRVLGKQFEIPADLVKERAVAQQYVETVERDFGSFTAPMHRVHLQLQISPRVLNDLSTPWQARLVEMRLIILAGLFGLATLYLGTVSSYFRIDSATGGAYRGPLKLASASIVTAASVGAASALFWI